MQYELGIATMGDQDTVGIAVLQTHETTPGHCSMFDEVESPLMYV